MTADFGKMPGNGRRMGPVCACVRTDEGGMRPVVVLNRLVKCGDASLGLPES